MEDENKALNGTVKTVSSTIDFDFKDNKIRNIKFQGDPKSDLNPIKKEIKNPQLLSGFRWLGDIRPRDKDDLYPKKILLKSINSGDKEPKDIKSDTK
jgi:hypothetical protein